MAIQRIQREQFTSPLAVACYILLASMALGAVLGVFAVVPALKNKCVWFTGNCQKITYQIAPNGTLLVVNPSTGYMYWYDGQFIYSYGNAVQGECAREASTATRTLQVVGPPVTNACLKYGTDSNGNTVCTLPSTQTMIPTQFDGAPVATGAPFEPVFVVNAYSMQLLPQKTSCALARTVVQNMFKNAAVETLSYNVPPDGNPLDIYQLFGLLQNRGVFVPPSTNTIWYNQSADSSSST